MASYEELAQAELENQIPEPGMGPPQGPLRLTVRPAGFAAPTNDLAQGQPWGAPDADTGRPGRLFEPDQTPYQPPEVLPRAELGGFRPSFIGAGKAIGSGLGSLVQGARDMFNAPQATTGDNTRQLAPRDPTAGPRQMWQQGYPSDPRPTMLQSGLQDVLGAPHTMIEAGRTINDPAATEQQVQQARQNEAGAAFDITSNLAGVGTTFAAARPGATAGIFGGSLSKSADLPKRQLAEAMEGNGLPPNRIWRETGWMRGADNKWMNEISDLDAFYTGNSFQSRLKMQQGQQLYLPDVVYHPQLYKAYPELRQMPVSKDMMMAASGSYHPRDATTAASIKYFEKDQPGNMARGKTFEVLLHEIQHGIQQIENFARGANPHRVGWENYPKYAGEVLADLPGKRKDLTPQQAEAVYPGGQMRPTMNEQIVEFNPISGPSQAQMSAPTLRGKAAEEAWRGTDKEPKLRTAVHPFSNVGGTPINEMQSPIIRGGRIINPRTLDIEKDLTNAELIFTGGDATGAGGKLHGSKDLPFETPVGRYGGPGYGSIMQGKPIAGHPGASPVWASMKGPMAEILNIAKDVERRGKEPWQVYMTGGKQYLDSSMQMVDTAIQAAKSKGVSTAANDHLVKVMQSDWNKLKPDPKRPFPETGFKDEAALKAWIDASPQPQRAKFVKAMDTKTARDLGFPNIGELRVWNTDPRMITAPPGSAGLALSRIDPSIGLIPSHHPAYNTAVGGRDVSTLGMQVPHQIIAPTMHESRMSTLKKPQYYEAAPHLYFPGGGTHAAKTEPVTNELKDRLQKWMKENPGGLAVAGTAGGLGSLVDPSRYEAR